VSLDRNFNWDLSLLLILGNGHYACKQRRPRPNFEKKIFLVYGEVTHIDIFEKSTELKPTIHMVCGSMYKN